MNVTVLDRSWKPNLPDLAVRGWIAHRALWSFAALGIIAQAGRIEFTAVKLEGIKSIILVSCLVHSSKF